MNNAINLDKKVVYAPPESIALYWIMLNGENSMYIMSLPGTIYASLNISEERVEELLENEKSFTKLSLKRVEKDHKRLLFKKIFSKNTEEIAFRD